MFATRSAHGTRARAGALILGLALAATACSSDGSDTLTLLTHDSFAISQSTLDAFTEETGIEVELLSGGDAGAMLAQAILTKDNPIADVIFGIDNTFLSRAVDEEITLPYVASALEDVHPFTRLDATNRFTPIDYGDVCLQYEKAAVGELDPSGLFYNPFFGDQLVVEDPATSSPGLAFLLATIAAFPDGWQDYWRVLRQEGVLVVPGWEEAYYGEFSGASDGDRPIVVSYASSPVAEVVFATEPIDEPTTAIVEESCFRQVEFAGVLDGTDARAEAEQFIDFMLSTEFQEDIPLNMYVFPALRGAALPPVFVEHAVIVDEPLGLEPAVIAANRDRWIEEWTEIVLR
ncbi:MAG: thiamine ABC transporter substrate-binding protein [Acidimicrobiia bacterium]|nr:thiamine ABC transporter substrate-binding protein [Acidimicrobiia bacterium]NNJ46920.1 thiamine ABC transporter substrate-binding protein [Acidimicrobiia bacterium]NNL13302.1 thiamine ABC transporter substrate-binding protein [Acidimicrobiia bacterium]